MKVSIIIPVYNVEKYLEICLYSVLNQTLKDIEIIAINDGSTDSSLDILNKYKEEYENIKIINQENKGIGATRNIGIKASSGEYIFFLDSDDYIELNAMEVCYNNSVANNLDILTFDANIISNNSIVGSFDRTTIINASVLKGKEIINLNLKGNSCFVCTWFSFFKRSFLDKSDIVFQEGIIYEDVLYTIKNYIRSDRVMYLPIKLYNYRIREESIMTTSKSIKNIESNYEVAKGLYDFYEYNKNTLDIETENTLLIHIINNYRDSIILCDQLNLQCKKEKIIKTIKESKYISNELLKKEILDVSKINIVEQLCKEYFNPYSWYKLAYVYELLGEYTEAMNIYINILKDNLDENLKLNIENSIKRINGEKYNKKRIYFILEHLCGEGGVETVLTMTTKELENRGYSVSLFLPNKSDNDKWENDISKLYYYDNLEKNILTIEDFIANRVKGLSNIIDKIGTPDIIVGTHVPITTLYSRLITGYNEKIPVISWLHNPYKIYYNPGYVNYADIHWNISEVLKKELENILKNKENNFYTGNPIETNVERKKLDEENRFLYIGRLENNQKRLDIVLYSLSQLKYEWTLDIYGDGEDREYFKEIVKELNISNKVVFHGFIKNPWEQINGAKALLLSSDFEGFGLVIAEALARGIPVISTNNEGALEMIEDGKNGFLANKGDINGYKENLECIINMPIDKLKQMSDNAIISVEKYSIKTVVDKMEKTFNVGDV